ncbi:hypothetical protein INR49_024030 [Caranx melampygus]|nr:hypothetical protein INR49_024030 [Caranx melampygus]
MMQVQQVQFKLPAMLKVVVVVVEGFVEMEIFYSLLSSNQICLKTKDCEGEVHASFAQLLNELNKKDALYALSVANRLYGEQSYQFVKDFLRLTRKHYQAELKSVDFKTKSEEARVNINSWVEKQTQGKIQDVLAKGMVDDMTRLVLVNAIYFKGNWKKKFKRKFTRDANFRLNKNDTKPVKMMSQTTKFPLTFIPEANCQVINNNSFILSESLWTTSPIMCYLS